MPHILPIHQISSDDELLVGVKANSLALLNNEKIPVPDGFCVTTQAFEYFLIKNGLKTKIEVELNFLNPEDPDNVIRVSNNIKKLISKAQLTKKLANEIFQAYEEMGSNDPYVSVRTSPAQEFYNNGDYALFLNVCGETTIGELVKEVWTHQFSPKFLTSNKSAFSRPVGVLVQRMINAQASGFLHTVDRGSRDKVIFEIEAVLGNGEILTKNRVSPDVYKVNKKNLNLIDKIDRNQETMLRTRNGQIIEKKLSKKELEKEILNEKEISKLAEIVSKIDKASFYPQSLEWVLAKDQIYILQSQKLMEENDIEIIEEKQDDISLNLTILSKGAGACSGIASGRVQIVEDIKDKKLIDYGEIVVAEKITPEMFAMIKKAKGIVTADNFDSGVSFIAREEGIPAIFGVSDVMEAVSQGETITIDGASGIIYSGRPDLKSKDFGFSRHDFLARNFEETKNKAYIDKTKIKTATSVYVNLPNGVNNSIFKNLDVDGVCYIRGENLIAEMGLHPKKLIYDKKAKLIEKNIIKRLEKASKEFKGKKIFYKFSDFQNIIFAGMNNGKEWEGDEPNPLLGYRGAFRHLTDNRLLEIEIKAIKKVMSKNKDLILLLPFIRSFKEFELFQQVLAENEIDLPVWIWAGSPSNLILLPEFINRGVNGFVIDLPHLTSLTLGVDEANMDVNQIYNEFDKSITWLIKKASYFANGKDIPCILNTKLAGSYPFFVKDMIETGIDGFCVPFDLVNQTRRLVKKGEESLFDEN